MWTCAQCSEKHDDSFDACWKCGADSRTTVATKAVRILQPGESLSVEANTIEQAVAQHFKCARCSGTAVKVKRISTTGGMLSRLLDVQSQRYLACSCQRCGAVELFDLEVIEGSDTIGTLLDLAFSR